MELSLNPVRPQVRIDGEVFSFESLRLDQGMNSCHRFELVRSFFTQDEMWQSQPESLVSLIGSRVLIRFAHSDTGHPYEFSGRLTDVQIDAWEDFSDTSGCRHRSNKVRFIGQGDVVVLAGTPTMYSYIDKQLCDIVSLTTQGVPFSVQINPRYKGILPYAMQYGESKFDFLNRLSCIYGELFYYDGQTLFFGRPDDPVSEDLYVDQDLVSLRTYSSAVPRKYTGYGYLPMEDRFIRTPDSFEPNTGNRLLETLTAQSDTLFPDKGVLESGTPAYYDSHLYDMADHLRSDAAGRMLRVEGETRTCRIKLGGLINILFPHRLGVPSLGQYRITEISHRIDKNGNYSNHFLAQPSKYEYVSDRFLHKVVAYPEVGTVCGNADPRGQGRVQVQFFWQKPLSQHTNWLRVQTPDAGSSDKVSSNRGLLAIPEVGDQVMVGFEYGDPHRPFVMGSLFHGKSGKGGGVANKTKSFSTRSGNRLELNDEVGSVLLTDPGKARLLFDGKGNASTTVEASHIVEAGADSSIMVGATEGGGAKSLFSMDNQGVIALSGDQSITINVGETTSITLSSEEITLRADKITIQGKGKSEAVFHDTTTIKGEEVDIN